MEAVVSEASLGVEETPPPGIATYTLHLLLGLRELTWPSSCPLAPSLSLLPASSDQRG